MAQNIFTDGNPSTGVTGTTVTAAFLNALGLGPDIETPVKSVAASATVDKDADHIVLIDCSSGAVTLTLPAVANVQTGRQFVFKRTDSSENAATIAGYGSETIDGAASVQIALQYEKIRLVSDGAAWYII